ncbi:MAG: hydrogenase expression/formation protein HypE [Anaerolineae bacterium]|nr:hydrogenase expression/formation protein HypE [Anaerolineae bacterium]
MPLPHQDVIVIGHGSGGRMTQDLIERIFKKYLFNPILSEGNDFARIPASSGSLIVSTDSHIITPLFFPGGDIGKLSVSGTVNDVAVSGAKPLYLTAGFIIEEGFSINELEKIVISMAETARSAGVQLVSGDTKVAEKGKVDKLFINTTGFGWLPEEIRIGGQYARPGDAVIVSGTLGDHGIAVLAARGELGFETDIESDVAPLNGLISRLLENVPDVHVLRDPTRGGLATTLNEIAAQSNVCITLEETDIPIRPEVKAACDMFGFDPLYLANEGKIIIILPEKHAAKALEILRATPIGELSTRIGFVSDAPQKRVLLKTPIGGTRILDVLAGEMLPRIC